MTEQLLQRFGMQASEPGTRDAGPGSATPHPSPFTPHRAALGFSLLEMLVVIMLVAIIATVVGVSISRSIFGAEVRSASKDVMAGLRYTRGQAIVKREEQLFQVDVAQRSYQAPGREPVTLPEGMEIRLLTARSELTGESSGAIRFFPDGSSTGGTVTLGIQGREWEVTVGWLTGEIGLKEGSS